MSKIDYICGIDRYEHSESYGKKVVEVAYLVKRPGKVITSERLTGVLAHGAKVNVVDTDYVKCLKYSKVIEADPIIDQEPQHGWLRNTLLLKAGLLEEGIKAYGESESIDG